VRSSKQRDSQSGSRSLQLQGHPNRIWRCVFDPVAGVEAAPGWISQKDGLPVFRPPPWIDPDQTEQPASNTTRQLALDHIPIRT
jgi:hypothetical protein